MSQDEPETMLIPLSQGKFAKVDFEDYRRVRQYKWYASFNTGKWYARHAMPGSPDQKEYLHHFILGVKGVDHINGDTLDNRRCNLRIATNSQNMANVPPRERDVTKYKGVRRGQNGLRWRAQITANRISHHLGTFDTEEEAARAYDAIARELFGEYAQLNFPD